MIRPPLSSSPPSQPSPYRYLGRGGGERPVRMQIIFALVAGMILVAVPLYLWRGPRPDSIPSADAAVADAGTTDASAPVFVVDAGPPPVTLSSFTTIRCENPGPGKTPPERCDHVTFFEDGLARAIRENTACAPTGKSQTTVSFVLEMDFRTKKTNLFVGKSSSIKRDKAKELLRCVKRAMPKPDWPTIPHQYVRYKVNVVATYPAADNKLSL
ncbi:MULTISPECIES: hypothetical protein [Polyangium]|uniref:Uncharacterized protein n=2 Tax=Polyangium TaxID=55 RepID=A0A4U1J3P9_9BACT|nr:MULTISPECIES: hypothetical protein [Polyangium]MDI1434040.1 hypothetical protein [Polyangium sorediatum]TKD01813.1 hypothetical protein E8A74_29955 [Polyangium fumosum]